MYNKSEDFMKNRKGRKQMITISQMAELVGGEVLGEKDVKVTGMGSPDLAAEGEVTFAVDEDQLSVAEKSPAVCIITSLDIKGSSKNILKVRDMKSALTTIYNALLSVKTPGESEIHDTSIVDKTAVLGDNVSIGPDTCIGKRARIGDNVFIGAGCHVGNNVRIGQNSRFFPNVTVYDNCIIGENVTVHAGTVIGADGFGYIPTGAGIYKVPQLGKVIIGDGVEIGANTCVDRGTFADTVIGENVKIDNLVQIAHNVKIGNNVIIAAQTGIAGSSTVGDNTMIGGQVGISDHIDVHKNTKIAAQSGVTQSTPQEGMTIFGYPARDARTYMKQIAFVAWLFKNAEKIRKLLQKTN